MRNEPMLDEATRKWIVATAYKRAWQLPDREVEDLIQEGYLCYVTCKERYGHNFGQIPTQGERKWFMALLKRTFENRLTSLVRKRMIELKYHIELKPNDDEYEIKDPGLTSFVDIILSAPAEVLEVLTKIVVEGQDVVTMVKREATRLKLGKLQKRVRYIETTNEKLCRLVGIDPKSKNLHREIKNLLEKT